VCGQGVGGILARRDLLDDHSRELPLPRLDRGHLLERCDGPVIRPADIVDEVLIMAMPLAPVHADRRDCGPLAERLAPDRAAAGDTARPFADLRARLRQED
jgi:uncharacterized metal-binding protein YceD (DUF177 family)